MYRFYGCLVLFFITSLTIAHAADGNITATAGANGSISPSGVVLVLEGTNQTFTINPDSGYQVDTLTVDGLSEATSTSYTFINVTADHTIDVTFSAIPLPTYAIVATAGTNGSITPSGTTTVVQGQNQTYTITPATGYGVATVTIDGVTTTPTTTVTFTNVTGSHTIDATFVPLATHTILASAGTNGTISPLGTTTVTQGNNQTYTITPAFGFGVATLTVDGASTTATTTHTFTNVTAPHTIAVTFALLPTHTILATAGVNGSMSPVGTTTVVQGQNQIFFITPATGFSVGTLTIDGVTTTPATTFTFTNVQAGHTIDVTFAILPTYIVTASSGSNGAISSPGTTTVVQGQNQTYTITPNTGFSISTLIVDGVTTTPTTTVTFTNVTGNHTIDVTFSALPTFTIVATAGANGTIGPVGTTSVTQGNSQTYTITPDSGFEVAILTVDGVSTAPALSYTFTNVMATHTIDVTFVEEESPQRSSSSRSKKRVSVPSINVDVNENQTLPSIDTAPLEQSPVVNNLPNTEFQEINDSAPSTEDTSTDSENSSTDEPDASGEDEPSPEEEVAENRASVISAIRDIPGAKAVAVVLLTLSILGGFFWKGILGIFR